MWTARSGAGARAGYARRFGFWNIEEYLPGVTCPTLVIQGVGDEYGTPEQLARIHAQLSGPSEVALLADCGHAPHRDQRELVLGMMHRFVRSVCAA